MQYFSGSADISSQGEFRKVSQEKIDEYIRNNYKDSWSEEAPLVSNRSLNHRERRYNIYLQDDAELQEVINSILSIVHEANTEFKPIVDPPIIDLYVEFKGITENYDNSIRLGKGKKPEDLTQIDIPDENNYPLQALKISILTDMRASNRYI